MNPRILATPPDADQVNAIPADVPHATTWDEAIDRELKKLDAEALAATEPPQATEPPPANWDEWAQREADKLAKEVTPAAG